MAARRVTSREHDEDRAAARLRRDGWSEAKIRRWREQRSEATVRRSEAREHSRQAYPWNFPSPISHRSHWYPGGSLQRSFLHGFPSVLILYRRSEAFHSSHQETSAGAPSGAPQSMTWNQFPFSSSYRSFGQPTPASGGSDETSRHPVGSESA